MAKAMERETRRATIGSKLVVLLLLIAASSARVARAADQPALVLVTKPPLALKDGDVVVPLGTTADEVEKKFGPPDRKSQEFRIWYYVQDGITLQFTPENRLEKITAYYNEKNGVHQSAARTDTGLGKGSSFRKIVAAHGKPARQEKRNGVNDAATYKITDNEFLTFVGQDLFAIELSATDPSSK